MTGTDLVPYGNRSLATVGSSPTVLPWPTFLRQWPREFGQGEHVTAIGPTGCGKTLLLRQLVQCRKHVVATGVKYKDESLSGLQKQGWKRINRWQDKPLNCQRVIVWPNESDINALERTHRTVFMHMLQDIYKRGGWCIWTDELRYMTDIIGLRKPYQQMYIAGRSNRISLVSAAQRPSHVPLEAYSQAQHLFLFRTGDERDLSRVGGLNGVSAKQVAQTVAELPFHHFLYINLRDGRQFVSTLQM